MRMVGRYKACAERKGNMLLWVLSEIRMLCGYIRYVDVIPLRRVFGVEGVWMSRVCGLKV